MNLTLKKTITQALHEDAAYHDITTQLLIPKNQISQAYIIIKEEAVVCGLDIVKTVFLILDRNIQLKTKYEDGQKIKKNTKILFLKGKTRALLSAERTALNFLSHLSGISTTTRAFVDQTKAYRAIILDTRKTTPGLRPLEKYAVRCGGGKNHRADLAQKILIKDNHRAAWPKSLAQMIKTLRKKTKKSIEIEVEKIGRAHV